MRRRWRPLLLEGGKDGGEEDVYTLDPPPTRRTSPPFLPLEEEVYTLDRPPREGGVTVSMPSLLQGGELARRKAYAHGKKAPQVRWFLERMRELVEGRHATLWGGSTSERAAGSSPSPGLTVLPSPGLTVLDVGGGRGDLAVNIGRHMLRGRGVERICVVDINQPSLDAGKAFVASLGLDNIDFLHAGSCPTPAWRPTGC